MKILIISGAASKEGVTHSFAQAAYEAAKESSKDAEIMHLMDYKLPVCRMCNDDGWGTCMSHHQCDLGGGDNFNELQEQVNTADAYVLITPVYWGGLSESMKIFFDRILRCQGSKQWDDKVGDSYLTGKPCILVANAGGSGGGALRGLEQLQHFTWCISGKVHDYIAVNRWNQEYKRETLRAAVKALG